MRIWKLKVEFGNYESLKLFFNDDYLEELKFKTDNAKSILEEDIDSKINKIEVIEGEERGDHPKIWNLMFIPAISRKGKEAIKDLVKNNCEFVRFTHKNEPYYLINILTVLDAVDYEKSVLDIYNTGLVVGFKKHAFKKDVIEGHNIFKIYLNGKIVNTEIFVSDDFKKVVEQAELKGFKFVEVWSD
ncbi:MAG: hypothetical protein JXN65_02140 [Clostridia bacterium]|nr:hypothetical protein [Clostridia bacterium]